MQKLFKYSFLLLLLGLSTVSVADLQKQLSQFHSFSATFKQTLTTQQGGSQTSVGHVWIQKPNRFRWQVDKPNKQLFVSDGKRLWNYEEGLLQVTVHPLISQLSQAPLLLLSGRVSSINKLFIVSKLGINRYQLIPKNRSSLIKKIILAFNKSKLSQLQFTNAMGQVSIIHFNDATINQQLAPGLFQFVPPKGVDVLR